MNVSIYAHQPNHSAHHNIGVAYRIASSAVMLDLHSNPNE